MPATVATAAAREGAGWDDTAAIARSWDRVVDDYKVFQAVRARGGTVDDLPATADGKTSPSALEEATEKDAEDAKDAPPERSDASGPHEHATAPAAAPNPGLLAPQDVLNGADDGLKKLLMSWYYAGYYTGLYEGQQQGQQGQETPQAPRAQETPQALQAEEAPQPQQQQDIATAGQTRDAGSI